MYDDYGDDSDSETSDSEKAESSEEDSDESEEEEDEDDDDDLLQQILRALENRRLRRLTTRKLAYGCKLEDAVLPRLPYFTSPRHAVLQDRGSRPTRLEPHVVSCGPRARALVHPADLASAVPTCMHFVFTGDRIGVVPAMRTMSTITLRMWCLCTRVVCVQFRKFTRPARWRLSERGGLTPR